MGIHVLAFLVSVSIILDNSLTREHDKRMAAKTGNKPVIKLKDMEEKHLHNLFLKNMSGLIEEVKNPTPRLNPNSKCGGMATHAGLALELGITRKKSLSPQMEAIMIWCQCRTREYDDVAINDFTQSGLPVKLSVHLFTISFPMHSTTNPSRQTHLATGGEILSLHSQLEKNSPEFPTF